MKTRDEVVAYGLTYADSYEDRPFRDSSWQLIRIKSTKKTFIWIFERNQHIQISVKVREETRQLYRDAYKSIIPGYHLNKEHWSTIILDGTVEDELICQLIDESYLLVTDSPTTRIYEAVKRIPKGFVATYGQVAEMAGDRNMARAVGNALHHNPSPDSIPCYRVVNAKGELAGRFAFGGPEVQAELLRNEGVEVNNNCVDLKIYRIEDLT